VTALFLHQHDVVSYFKVISRNEYPIFAARLGALLRCSSFVWLATRHSSRLASHPVRTTLMGYSFLEIT